MYQQKNWKLFLSLMVLVLAFFLPKTVGAESVEQWELYVEFSQPDLNKITVINNEAYDLRSLEDGKILVDFDSPKFKDYGISGKLVYRKANNTIEFQSVNNVNSNYHINLNIGERISKDLTYRFVGANDIKGQLDIRNLGRGKTIFTGDGLRMTNKIFESTLRLSDGPWQISDTKIQVQYEPNKLYQQMGLEYSGTYPMEIINSTIDIKNDPLVNSDNHDFYGIYSQGPMDFFNSKIRILGKNKVAYGLWSTKNISFNESNVNIETEGKIQSFALAAQTFRDVSLKLLNSEIYLNAKLAKDAEEGSLACGLSSFGNLVTNVSNSILQTQGNTGALQAVLEFREKLHDVYVKENLNEDKQIYPIRSKEDKINLSSSFDGSSSGYKFVRIEPHLKSFTIDADSQPVDQKTYEFVRWEVEGFIIDNPTEKKATVKIPVLWNKKASLKAIWKKNDGSIKTVPVATDSTVIYKMPQKIVYKTPLSDMPYLVGYPDMTIQPEGNMTRGEAIATVVRLERIKEKDGKSLKESKKTIYSDVKDGAWYKKYITYAYDHGWLETKSGEAFYPDRPITRGELAQLISHIDRKNVAVAPFEDVKGHKYEAAINQAYGNERIKGYGDGTFRPDGQVKRVEVEMMLNHLYDRRPDKRFIDQHHNIITPFKDLDRHHWGYYELVEAFEAHEYVRNDKNEEEWIRLIDSAVK